MSIALSCKKFLKVYNCKQEMHTKMNEDEFISKKILILYINNFNKIYFKILLNISIKALFKTI